MRKKNNILNRETSKQINCKGMMKPIKRKKEQYQSGSRGGPMFI